MIATEGRFIVTTIKEIGVWDWTGTQKCAVCGLPIRDEQEKVYCPHCGNPAHFAHLAEWVKVKGACPICRNRVDMRRLKPLTM